MSRALLLSLLFGCEASGSSSPSSDDGRCHEVVSFWNRGGDVHCPPGSRAEVLSSPGQIVVTCRCPPASSEVSDGR